MRDIILLGLLPFLLYCCFKRPFIGLALWLWSSLVPVSVYGYGMATSVRWNFIFAVCTILSYLIRKYKPEVKIEAPFVLMLFFFIHATISTVFHMGFDLHVWQEWSYLLKSIVFFIFVILIVENRIHFDALMWACVLSISVKAAEDGIKVFFSGGSHIVGGISPTFNDNNLSAMASLMCIPMMFYLYVQYKNYLLFKLALIGLIATNVLFVFGTDSRGGFLGLMVLGGYFFIKSNRKLPIALALTVLGFVGLSFVDQAWFERMQTIQDASEDGSFMGRVISWKLAIILALENPIFGGGFDAAAYGPTWQYLVSDFDRLSFITTPEPSSIHVAHSIYFQVLGDLGFVGLGIYLALILGTYRRFNNIRTIEHVPSWVNQYGQFMALAIIAFSVAGAALNVAYNEIFLMLVASSIALSARLDKIKF